MGTAYVDMRGHSLRAIILLTLIVRQLLLCDMAFIGEYAEGNMLTVYDYVLRRGITAIPRTLICSRRLWPLEVVIDLDCGPCCLEESA